jgi:hypothetical protein
MHPPAPHKKYSKLEAFGELSQEAGGDELHSYLILGSEVDECARAMQTIRRFIDYFESPMISGISSQKDLSSRLSVPITNWRDKNAWEAVCCLFSAICRSSETGPCATREGIWTHHEAMLRLCGFQLDDRPMAFSVSFNLCTEKSPWQPIHLKSRE